MHCAVTASTNAHYLSMQAQDRLQAAREAWAERNKDDYLACVYFVTERMAAFICQNETLGALWQAGNTDEFLAEIKAFLDREAYEAALDEAASLSKYDLTADTASESSFFT